MLIILMSYSTFDANLRLERFKGDGPRVKKKPPAKKGHFGARFNHSLPTQNGFYKSSIGLRISWRNSQVNCPDSSILIVFENAFSLNLNPRY